MDTPFLEELAIELTGAAQDVIDVLDQLSTTPTTRVPVVAAIQIYEREVLHEVTYHPA